MLKQDRMADTNILITETYIVSLDGDLIEYGWTFGLSDSPPSNKGESLLDIPLRRIPAAQENNFYIQQEWERTRPLAEIFLNAFNTGISSRERFLESIRSWVEDGTLALTISLLREKELSHLFCEYQMREAEKNYTVFCGIFV